MVNNIRTLASKQNKKLIDIARETGLKQPHLHYIVYGKYVPNIVDARKIASALNSTLEEVFPNK